MKQTQRAAKTLHFAMECCKELRNEFVMPEHLLLVLTDNPSFDRTFSQFSDINEMADQLEEKLGEMEMVPQEQDYDPEASEQMEQVIAFACEQVLSSSAQALDIPHLVMGILHLEESWACYLLKKHLGDNLSNFMSELISTYEFDDHLEEDTGEKKREDAWRKLVTCMNEHYQKHNPLIGREQELQRTIQVLCRRDKNNPLHVGEPGVGKTALVWGLARMIEEDRVPERLKGSRIYQLDIGTLLAGTQYRGDFENRIKQIMDGIQEESDRNIVYIDEIHTLVGAGAIGEGSMDASNMLKPYLEGGAIRFIGSTTYEEYNRHFSRSKGLVRRFQQIDIPEPTPEETKHILRQLRSQYENYHHVTYDESALDFAVDASYKHVNDRYLPDKAIDLIDEAGAYLVAHGSNSTVVDKTLIASVLARISKVDALAVKDDDTERLETIEERIKNKIYGQDSAVKAVVEAVQMSKAGLTDESKPLASLLFVGPTGVGKTEVARVLAREMGVELVRFDMSEYVEKHTVAKLIGSPAGYVGYEDGGLLTDAVRRAPDCVLLLDEIEKAHDDIFNILLQVMDYGVLTDNKGRKAYFRNVVLIMTSNAGAQFASQASVGFASTMTAGKAMLQQVKKTFKPEFVNRLSGIVVFNDMDDHMARLILDKKLRELDERLATRKVTVTLTEKARLLLMREGYSRQYGAREMDRAIQLHLKSLLMREILFGSLKNGGHATVTASDNKLILADA